MTPDQIKVLLERVDQIQNSLDTIDRDLGHDRKDIQDLSIRVGKMELQLEELRKQSNGQVDKIQDKVTEAIAPMLEEAQDLRETIDAKKVVAFKVKTFWDRIRRK